MSNTNTQHSNHESRAEGSPDPSVLGARLAELTHAIAACFEDLDVAAMSGEDFTAQMFPFMAGGRDLILEGGEKGFIARRAALFLSECLSASLRRGRRGDEVPHEHAAIIDAVYQKFQSAKSGVSGETPDVEQLNKVAETAQQQMQNFLMQAGLVRKVPTEANEPRIVLSG